MRSFPGRIVIECAGGTFVSYTLLMMIVWSFMWSKAEIEKMCIVIDGASSRRLTMNEFLNSRAVRVLMVTAVAAALLLSGFIGAAAQGHRADGGEPSSRARGDNGRVRSDDYRVTVARLKYGGGGDWYADPSSLPNFLGEFERRTGIPTASAEKVIEPGDPELSSYPFLYMTGHGNVSFSGSELERLRDHLLAGGFLYADDNYGMDESFRKVVARLLPGRELVPVPLDHPIYSCFYELEGPPKIHEHDGRPPEGLGIFEGERLILFYTYESDVGDGLEDPDVHGDPPEKRELAMRMAVNVFYYALTR